MSAVNPVKNIVFNRNDKQYNLLFVYTMDSNIIIDSNYTRGNENIDNKHTSLIQLNIDKEFDYMETVNKSRIRNYYLIFLRVNSIFVSYFKLK